MFESMETEKNASRIHVLDTQRWRDQANKAAVPACSITADKKACLLDTDGMDGFCCSLCTCSRARVHYIFRYEIPQHDFWIRSVETNNYHSCWSSTHQHLRQTSILVNACRWSSTSILSTKNTCFFNPSSSNGNVVYQDEESCWS